MLASVPARAQGEPPPFVAFADHASTIERESDAIDAAAGEPVLPGDRLRTSTGRAEVWFPDASTLTLDDFSTVEIRSGRVRHVSGRSILVVARGRTQRSPDGPYQVDTASGSIVIAAPGEYRISVWSDGPDPAVELTVVRGRAALVTDGGTASVAEGERVEARGDGPPSIPERLDSLRLDAFDTWAAERRDERRVRTASSTYLPDSLRVHASAFDRYGAWEDDPSYGQVWYPAVAPGWRPYYNGYWRPLRAYGWTWIGRDAWSWPTHHYGRWGIRGARWFWIPDRWWGPAWVSWATAADYVSWCPLGFDDRPVMGVPLSLGNAWAGWVVMPRTYFGSRPYAVNRYSVQGRRLPRGTAFALHPYAPASPYGRPGDRDVQSRVRSPRTAPSRTVPRRVRRYAAPQQDSDPTPPPDHGRADDPGRIRERGGFEGRRGGTRAERPGQRDSGAGPNRSRAVPRDGGRSARGRRGASGRAEGGGRRRGR